MKMKMKKLIYGLFTVAALASSCNGYLDKAPDSRLEIDTPEKVAMLLVSAYPLNAPLSLLELMSDNFVDNGLTYSYGYEMQPEAYLYKDQSTVTIDTPHNIWERCFKSISTANTALGAAKDLEKKGYDLSQYIAEARMCRAWNHFLLAAAFCKAYNPQTSDTDLGLPYVTARMSDVFAKLDRGTVKQLWDSMNDDIEAALPDLRDDAYKVPKYHFNRKAAYCFAAEFNLYYGNYDKAVKYADLAMGSDPESVMRDMRDIFNTALATDQRQKYFSTAADCNLMIMSLNSIAGRIHSGSSNYASRYGHSRDRAYAATYRSAGPWSGKTGNKFNTKSLALYSSYGTEQAHYYPKMMEIYDITDASVGTGTSRTIWMPFTVEKALLTRAEANVLQGNYEEAAYDLSLWYTSHHGEPVFYSPDELAEYYKGVTFIENEEEVYTGAVEGMTKFDLNPRFEIAADGIMEYMILAVLHVRRIEFLFEGWRTIDIKRYGIQVTHNVARSSDIVIRPWDDRLDVQLPFMVLAAGMEPNPR